MSHYTRDTSYLDRHRIFYRCDPVDDKPTEVFDWGNYYEAGTRQCYTLFNSKAKITLIRVLNGICMYYGILNPQMDQEDFKELSKYICNKKTGFVTFKVSEQLLQSMIYDVSLMDLETPPPNKLT